MLTSSLCTQAALESPSFVRWVRLLSPADVKTSGTPRMHRKLWEWAFIAQALDERGCLRGGRRGLGFAVGQEPLPVLFAGRGCDVLATDVGAEHGAAGGWADQGQHAAHVDGLARADLCPPDEFRDRVRFRPVDMNHVPDDLRDFDFCWSSCSFEHLGSLDLGLRFVERSLACLRPGGVAVHTTEFNLSSDTYTVAEGHDVIFRRTDIEGLAARLTAAGHAIRLDFSPGGGPLDHQIDPPPYRDEPHLKLLLMGYVTTSLGLVIEKGAGPRPTGLVRRAAAAVRRLSAAARRRPAGDRHPLAGR